MKQNESKDLKDKKLNLPEIKITDTPWLTQPRYKMWFQVEGSAGTSKTLYFTKTARAGTWVVNYTWFWFIPTWYIIQAWYKWSLAWTSTSYCTNMWWVVWGFYQYPWFQNENTTRAIIIWNAWATITTRANFSAFISDWIALNYVDSGNDVRFTITAFK